MAEMNSLLLELNSKMQALTAGCPAAIPALRSADKLKLYAEGDFKTLWIMEREDKETELNKQLKDLGYQMMEILEEKRELEIRVNTTDQLAAQLVTTNERHEAAVKALTQSHEAALQDVRRELKDLRARSRAEIADSMREVKNLEFKLQLALRFPAATREYYMTPLVPSSP